MTDKRHKKKLWETGSDGLNTLVERYTVGDDYVTDAALLPYDVRASIAHAQMLGTIGVLNEAELTDATDGLAEILKLWERGEFAIAPEQEDCHTAIEQYLTEHWGEIGKKIHTGRSRNDQSLVMIRLYMKEQLGVIDTHAERLTAALRARAGSADIPMPGYTHQQKAMPTTVATWLSCYADALADARTLLSAARNVIDQNPLGSASGFGIGNFPLDREATTRALGFSRVQENPLYCGLSRGHFESLALSSLDSLMFAAERFANDMLLFTMQEFEFFSLPESFTTGSSIMPQKRNYDLFEIMRGNAKVFRALERQVRDVAGSGMGGYHRDLQLTKKPLVEGCALVETTLALLNEIVPALHIHEDRLKAAMTDDLYATERVYELVKGGMSFRDAYERVKKDLWKNS